MHIAASARRGAAGEPAGKLAVPTLRPRLTLRIGVTGHRLGGMRLSEGDLPAIEKMVAHTLAVMRGALDDVLRDNRDIFADAPPLIRFISALAEGADQAAAQAALAQGAALECPLPFLRRDYARDFKALSARREFYRLLRAASAVFQLPGRRRDEEEAYETVGLIMLRQSDLVIAVWDGNLKEPKRGGTAEMVIKAFETGIPVLWLHPAQPKLRLLEKQGAALGTTLWELVDQGGSTIDDAGIQALVHDLVAPPGSGAHEANSVQVEARARLCAFLAETEKPTPRFWPAYPLLLRFLGNRRGAPRLEASPLREAFTVPPPKIRNFESALALIDARHGRADRLSVHLGQVYRSGYVMNYGLAAAVVFFALVGLVFHHELKPVYVFLELAIIGVILAVTLSGNARRWHDRWLDYRQLAEQLRHLRFLCFAGTRSAEPRAAHINEAVKPGPPWIDWYWRATLRELPLMHALVDERFVARLGDAVAAEIEEQAYYHALNAHRLKHVHEGLDSAGDFLFRLTAAVCVLFIAGVIVNRGIWEFAGPDLSEHAVAWASFLGGLLPAIGAALYGIRIQGDFKAAAERSAVVAARLSSLMRDLGGKRPASFAKAARIADEAASIMTAELSDWSMIFREKPLSLPA